MMYLALDGGGTKTLAICYDDRLKLLGMGKSGGMNTNFEPVEQVRAHLVECLEACLAQAGAKELDGVYLSGPGPHSLIFELLKERLPVRVDKPDGLGEAMNGVFGGLCANRGLSVLSGTGSNVGYIEDGKFVCGTGGWGGFIGDEGSGCWIGQYGIQAAIAGHDGWGKPSLIEKLLLEQWHIDELHGVIPRVFLGRSMRVEVSAACPIVGQAARMGDELAIEVLKGAAEILARQARALIRNKKLATDLPVVAIGSAWKAAPVMFEHFRQEMLSEFPHLTVQRGLFDQIMGSVVRLALHGRSVLPEEEKAALMQEFAPLLSRME